MKLLVGPSSHGPPCSHYAVTIESAGTINQSKKGFEEDEETSTSYKRNSTPGRENHTQG